MPGDGRPPLRVALIGCGEVGRRRAEIITRSSTGQLVLAVDRDLDRAQRIATETGSDAETDWHAALKREDFDAVVVATPHDVQASIAIAAVHRGKHVLVEKPMARTPAEAESVMREAGAATAGRHLVFKVGFTLRHHPAIAQAHAAVVQGDIGEPYSIRCRYGHGGRPGYETEWRTNRDIAGGGELLDQGIHVLDLFRWFLGEFVEGVGFTPTYHWRRAGDEGPGSTQVEDNAFGLFRTVNGQVASFHVSWTQWKNLFSFEVFGRDGHVIVEGLGGSYGMERLTKGRRRPASGPPDEQQFEFRGSDSSWEEEWREFVAAIQEKRAPLGTAADAWQALRMIYAVYESQRTGAVVRL